MDEKETVLPSYSQRRQSSQGRQKKDILLYDMVYSFMQTIRFPSVFGNLPEVGILVWNLIKLRLSNTILPPYTSLSSLKFYTELFRFVGPSGPFQPRQCCATPTCVMQGFSSNTHHAMAKPMWVQANHANHANNRTPTLSSPAPDSNSLLTPQSNLGSLIRLMSLQTNTANTLPG